MFLLISAVWKNCFPAWRILCLPGGGSFLPSAKIIWMTMTIFCIRLDVICIIKTMSEKYWKKRGSKSKSWSVQSSVTKAKTLCTAMWFPHWKSRVFSIEKAIKKPLMKTKRFYFFQSQNQLKLFRFFWGRSFFRCCCFAGRSRWLFRAWARFFCRGFARRFAVQLVNGHCPEFLVSAWRATVVLPEKISCFSDCIFITINHN